MDLHVNTLTAAVRLLLRARGLRGWRFVRAMRPIESFDSRLAALRAVATSDHGVPQKLAPWELRQLAATFRSLGLRALELIEHDRAWPGRAELEGLVDDLREGWAACLRRAEKLEQRRE